MCERRKDILKLGNNSAGESREVGKTMAYVHVEKNLMALGFLVEGIMRWAAHVSREKC